MVWQDQESSSSMRRRAALWSVLVLPQPLVSHETQVKAVHSDELSRNTDDIAVHVTVRGDKFL